jgi:MerR family transcriptional regulator, light-induced transcriptional regulator
MLAIPPSTLRGWHRRYDIPPAEHDGRHRRYTTADIEALGRMKSMIARGVDAQSAANLAFHPAGTETGPSDLVEAALRLDTDALVAMLDAHISVHGVVDTWDGLCGPALNELGGETVDVDNYVDVVHLLSWAITVSLHRVTIAARPPRPPVLLACPADEHHVLPLEALRAALAERDVPANLLGANLPDAALRDALRRVDPPPAALVLWAHSPGTAHTMLTRGRTRSRLVLAGPGWPRRQRTAGLASLTDALELLTS